MKKIKLLGSTKFNVFLLLICMSAPLWAKGIHELKGRRLFLEVDSLVFLGVMIAVGLTAKFVMPGKVMSFFGVIAKWVRKYSFFLLLFLSIGMLVLLIYTNKSILYSFMNSADEHSCLFLAECIRMGKWVMETHPLQDFFEVVHVGSRDGKWFSVYPPGWPLLMAIAIQFNILDLMNPFLTVLSFVFLFLAGKKIYGEISAFLALLLCAFTPFLLFTGASYYSHSTCLLTVAVFLWSYAYLLDAKDEKSKFFWSAILSIAVGYGLVTRYLTMAAIAGPFLVYYWWPVFRRREKLCPHHVLMVLIMSAAMLVIFWQNFQVTGKPFKAPNRYDKSWERLGFRDFYTPVDALIFLVARGFYLIDWSPGVYLLLYLFTLSSIRSFSPLHRLVHLVFLFPAFAYFFYFSWGGNQYGPRYYWEGFPVLMLSSFGVIERYWSELADQVKKYLVGILIAAVAVSCIQYVKHANYFELVSSQRSALFRYSEETLKEPSIVFIRGFLGQELVMSQDDAIRNHPALEAKIIYAKDKLDENEKLLEHYPNRRAYIGSFNRQELRPELVEVDRR